ncbi:hypothetical protein [Halogeometricum luteum]|uniref:Small Multidrug Resistance protein n=1 Tax=Halogeometricum luteum TaxID=2950537 RepID=A0ABU2G4N7_9EURY|nr:hypothetical protein [Halogeometricum sp. S3BR5-2]MDS0295179.1 hypothetical protein [Halogeometricum sp. S3BR5-2]
MERMYVYYGFLALWGGTAGTDAVRMGTEQGWGVPIAVQGAAGALLVAVSGWKLATESPSDFEVGPAGFWAVVIGVSVIVIVHLL